MALFGGVSGLTSSQSLKIGELPLNIKDRNGKRTGAIGDGTSHPLSEFYSTLALAQADYPVATALTQEVDGVVLEQLISDEEVFYMPSGTYMVNYAIVQSNKTFRAYGPDDRSAVIQCNASSIIGNLLTLNGCTIHWENIAIDGDHLCKLCLRNDNGVFYGFNVEARSFGDPVDDYTQATVGFFFDDPISVYFDRVTGSDIQSRSTGQIVGDDGLASLIQIGNASVSTQKGWAYVKNFYFDATGSQAPQLDPLKVTIDSLTHITVEAPVIRYNEYCRRAIKMQGSNWTIKAPDIRPCATFTPDGAGTTDVGSYCLNCIDATATTGVEGGGTILGGYIDASGFIVALGRTTGTATFRAIGTIVVGSTKRARKLINIEGQRKTADTSNISGEILTLTSHGYNTAAGASVIPDSGGTLPTGLSEGALYYTRSVSANEISFHPTSTDATNNTNRIAISGGSGTFTLYTGLDTDHVGFYTDTQSGYGSGVQNCTFNNFTLGFYLRAQFSFVKDCTFYDPQEYVGYVGTGTNSKGHEVSGNTVVTVTSGALNNSRLIRIFDVTDSKFFNNRLIQNGNTGHANRFFDSTDADSTNLFSFGNIAPAGTTPFNVNSGKAVILGNNLLGTTAQTTSAANVGTGEDNLQTLSIVASPFYQNGDWIQLRARGRFANNANAKTLKFYWGSTVVYTKSLPTSVAGNWAIDVLVARTGTNAQDIEYVAHITNSAGTGTDTEMGRTTATESESASVTVKCTGEGTTSGDITGEMLTWNK